MLIRGISARAYSTVPVKSYGVNNNAVKLFWNTRVSPSAKYISLVLSLAYTLTHFHPNTLFTVGPPLVVAGAFGYSRWHKRQFQECFNSIKPLNMKQWEQDADKIHIERYDESDKANVLAGIESEFDNFKVQMLQVVEKRILDYVVDHQGTVRGLFVENDQFSLNVSADDIETFVTAPVDVAVGDINTSTTMIKFSVPFYSSRGADKKRLGVIGVCLLEVPQENSSFHRYKSRITVYPYGFSGAEEITPVKDTAYSSEKLQKYDEYEEITVGK